jgi:ATP-dependent DNA helicase RecQ
VLLLSYFGESQAKRCGYCDYCRKRNRVNVSELEFERIVEKIKPRLISAPCPLETILSAVPDFAQDDVINVLRWLEDNGKIVKDEAHCYSWRKQFRLKF